MKKLLRINTGIQNYLLFGGVLQQSASIGLTQVRYDSFHPRDFNWKPIEEKNFIMRRNRKFDLLSRPRLGDEQHLLPLTDEEKKQMETEIPYPYPQVDYEELERYERAYKALEPWNFSSSLRIRLERARKHFHSPDIGKRALYKRPPYVPKIQNNLDLESQLEDISVLNPLVGAAARHDIKNIRMHSIDRLENMYFKQNQQRMGELSVYTLQMIPKSALFRECEACGLKIEGSKKDLANRLLVMLLEINKYHGSGPYPSKLTSSSNQELGDTLEELMGAEDSSIQQQVQYKIPAELIEEWDLLEIQKRLQRYTQQFVQHLSQCDSKYTYSISPDYKDYLQDLTKLQDMLYSRYLNDMKKQGREELMEKEVGEEEEKVLQQRSQQQLRQAMQEKLQIQQWQASQRQNESSMSRLDSFQSMNNIQSDDLSLQKNKFSAWDLNENVEGHSQRYDSQKEFHENQRTDSLNRQMLKAEKIRISKNSDDYQMRFISQQIHRDRNIFHIRKILNTSDALNFDMYKYINPLEVANCVMMTRLRDVVIIDVREKNAFTDFLIIGTAISLKHVWASMYAAQSFCKEKIKEPSGGLGCNINTIKHFRRKLEWQSMEIGGRIMLNVMTEPLRLLYKLEQMWANEDMSNITLLQLEDYQYKIETIDEAINHMQYINMKENPSGEDLGRESDGPPALPEAQFHDVASFDAKRSNSLGPGDTKIGQQLQDAGVRKLQIGGDGSLQNVGDINSSSIDSSSSSFGSSGSNIGDRDISSGGSNSSQGLGEPNGAVFEGNGLDGGHQSNHTSEPQIEQEWSKGQEQGQGQGQGQRQSNFVAQYLSRVKSKSVKQKPAWFNWNVKKPKTRLSSNNMVQMQLDDEQYDEYIEYIQQQQNQLKDKHKEDIWNIDTLQHFGEQFDLSEEELANVKDEALKENMKKFQRHKKFWDKEFKPQEEIFGTLMKKAQHVEQSGSYNKTE